MLVLGLIGFLAVGLSLGMLGGGGSILAVPVLVHLLGLPASVAVPMSLPVVGAASALGAWRRWRMGQLQLRLVAIFAAGTMLASFAAARLGAGIADRPRLFLFTGVMLIAATLMWRRARAPLPVEVSTDGPQPHVSLLVVASLVVGALTGLVGVGGGFLIVPALVGVLGLGMAEATATSLAVIALNTGAASAGWWGRVELDWWLTTLVTVAALGGMMLGTTLAPRVPARTLTRAFAALLIVVGVFMLVKT
ncbi:MAG TPA: sulfite exporter TauE/SafE family protein [Gemmatimonadales bacterium]|nr:sulfite exporter TauE/SafE family protein [Gemmatimonadales bacterium]